MFTPSPFSTAAGLSISNRDDMYHNRLILRVIFVRPHPVKEENLYFFVALTEVYI